LRIGLIFTWHLWLGVSSEITSWSVGVMSWHTLYDSVESGLHMGTVTILPIFSCRVCDHHMGLKVEWYLLCSSHFVWKFLWGVGFLHQDFLCYIWPWPIAHFCDGLGWESFESMPGLFWKPFSFLVCFEQWSSFFVFRMIFTCFCIVPLFRNFILVLKILWVI
jgi:hypothetical protein